MRHITADVMAGRRLDSASAPGAEQAGGEGGQDSYEELCRAHMEALMAQAAAQEVQTELAQRVSK